MTNADGESETVTKHNYINVTEAYNMQNGTVETCDAMFYDDGGPTANYQDRKDYTMTFLPAATGGMLEAVFEEFAAENGWDFLYIHDGTSTDATQIGEYTGSNSPGTVTATNPDGALTFHFVSDQNTNAAGWIARVHCIGTGHEPLEIEVFADPQTINEGQTSQLSVYAFGGSGNYTYRWEPAEMVVEPEAQITNTIPLTSSEAFTVTVADGEGNTVYATIQVTVIPDVNVIENTMDKVLVYPNPNNGTFTIEAEGETDYQLFNSLGQCILSGVCKGKSQIEVQDLRQGVYFLQFIGKQGTETEKIVIE